MSIWVGENSYGLDCGDIFLKENKNQDPKSIRAVFVKNHRGQNTMIWPYDSKYLFFLSTEDRSPFIDITSNRTIITDASPKTGTNALKIYVRSSARYYRHKYPFKFEIVGDDFATVNGTTSMQTVTPINDGTNLSTEAKYDAVINVDVTGNHYFSRRRCFLKVYQIDDRTGMPTGKYDAIEILQKADEEIKSELTIDKYLREGKVTWYTDQTFSKTTASYGSETDGANPTNGTTQIYFTVGVNAPMLSGYTFEHLYGLSSDEKDFNFTIKEENSIIASIYNISQDGKGHWSATVKWKDNTTVTKNKTDYITNVTNTLNGKFNYSGFINAELKWTVMYGGIMEARSTVLGIGALDSTNKFNYIQRDQVELWQKKDEVYNINKNADCKVSLPPNIDWVTYNSVVNNNDGTYTIQYTVNAQTSKIRTFILSKGKTTFDAYNNTNAKLYCDLYWQPNYFEERKTIFTITYNKASANAVVEQQSTALSNPIKLAYPNDLFTLSLNYAESITASADDSYVKFIDNIDTSKLYMDAQTGYITCDVIIQDNPKQKVEETIYNVTVPNYISYEEQESENITWQIVSAEINSELRKARLVWTLVPKDTTNILSSTLIVDYYQNGSTDASGTIYHDNINCTLTNITDNLSSTINKADSTTHLYTVKLKVAENNRFDKESQQAYVEPTEVKDYSVGTLDNANNSAVFAKIYGVNVYKGKDRNIDIKITATDNSKELFANKVIKQLANPNIKDISSLAPVTSIDTSIITVTGQAKLSTTQNIVSTNLGWWKIPLEVDKNDTPTGYVTYASVNNIEDNKDFEVTLSGTEKTNIVPIRGWWQMLGKPISETATISIGNIKTFNAKWNIVPYSGDNKQYYEPLKDWDVETTDASDWISISSSLNTISLAENKTGSDRNGHLNFRFKNGDTQLTPINITINQKKTTISDSSIFGVDNDQITLTCKNGDISASIIKVHSYNNISNEVLPITISPNTLDGLIYESNIIKGYGYLIKLLPTAINESAADKTWQLTITQSSTNEVLNVNVIQQHYTFNVSADTNTTLSTAGTNTSRCIVSVTSSSNTFEYWYINNMPEWLTTRYNSSDNNKTTLELSVNSLNNSFIQRSADIEFVQGATGLKKYITIKQDAFKELEDNRSINLYGHDTVKRNIWSSVNGQPISNISIEHSEFSTIDTKNVTFTIVDDVTNNGNFDLVITAEGWNNSMNYQYDEITLSNDYYTIGKIPVTIHGTIFTTDSEEDDEDMPVWYTDREARKVFNVYMIKTYLDNSYADYEIEGISGSFNASLSANAVSVWSLEDNDTSDFIEGSIIFKQKISNKRLIVKLKQRYN